MKSVFVYLSSILVANWLVIQFGVIEIGYLIFPAGAVAIGFTFSARDYVQRRYGKFGCWLWMVIAGILTWFLNPKIAFASVSAFAVSEIVDWLLFTYSSMPFKKRIILSNAISTPIDSIVFVSLAFGMYWPIIIGQTVVKFLSSCIVLVSKR